MLKNNRLQSQMYETLSRSDDALSKTLIQCAPLLVLKEFAGVYGLNNAIFLQQLHYWIVYNYERECDRPQKKHYRDGRWWIYSTVAEWKIRDFPFWSVSTINRIIKELKTRNLLYVESKYNARKGDNTHWFSINYDTIMADLPQYENVRGDGEIPQLKYRKWKTSFLPPKHPSAPPWRGNPSPFAAAPDEERQELLDFFADLM